MKRRLWIPVVLSVVSGAIVSTQVYLVRRSAVHPSDARRILIALRELPPGHRLHPRDFTLDLVPGIMNPDVIDAEASHGLWGRPLSRGMRAGEMLTHGRIATMQERKTIRRAERVEIIQEIGE